MHRPHEDLDVAVPRGDLDPVIARLSGYHLWAAQNGSLTPLRCFARLPENHEQLWVRRDAQSPWVLDLHLQPVDGDDWVFRRDHRIRVPMSTAIQVTDGIPHLAPELALLHKAHLCRPKDDADVAATLPTLSIRARGWLAAAIAVAVPDSPWREQLEVTAR